MRYPLQRVRSTPAYHSHKTDNESKIPMMKSLLDSWDPHYWNFSKPGLIPHCYLHSHRLCFMSSAELLGNWGQRRGPSRGAASAALAPPALVKLGTGLCPYNPFA